MVENQHKNRSWMNVLAVLALIAGLLVGLAALLAPLGVWTGWWEFGTGFGILRSVVPYSGYVALACLLLAVLLAVLASAWHTGNAGKLGGMALVGALAAAIAWYIPNSFQAPEGQSYPAIHDISTDTQNPPEFVAILPLRADAANTAEYGRSEGMTPEELARLQNEAYADIQPVVLDVPPAQAFDRALAAVEEMGWELVDADAQAGRIEATDTTFWFRFKDDVVIRLQPAADGTRIDVRSVSRVGRSDIGTNAKRIREYLAVLQGS